jgi:hypothetical protein
MRPPCVSRIFAIGTVIPFLIPLGIGQTAGSMEISWN